MARLSKIFWKRTYLFIEYLAETEESVCLKKGNLVVPFEVKLLEQGVYRAKLNLCIAEGRRMLSDGEWIIYIGETEIVDAADEVLLNLETLSNVYRYDGDKAYIVTFHLNEMERERFSISLKVDYMMKNPRPEKRTGSITILKCILNAVYRLVRVCSSKKGNRILFLNENSNKLDGNAAALYNRMLERGLGKTHKITVSCRNIFAKKQNPVEWLKTVVLMAKQDYIFVEDYVPVLGFLDIDEKTTVVQLWHAGFGFKGVGYGRFGLTGSPNPFESCHRKYTYGIIGNENLREVYSEVWGIEKESLLATGMPRLSNFLDEQLIEKTKADILEKLPMIKGKRVITFAPTYRGSNQKEAYYDMGRIDQNALHEYCKETDSIVLMKFHSFLKGHKLVDEAYKEYIIDASDYNLNDLFYVTDLLITDYSSCFYDFILLGKPVLFYVYDEVHYSAMRGICRPVSKVAPGKICKSFDELMDAIKSQNYEDVEIPDFMVDRCSLKEPLTASDKIIDYVIFDKKDMDI